MFIRLELLLCVMATNVTVEYQIAEKEYHQASSTEDKIRALMKMLSTVPKHKGTEKLQQQIKERIAKLRGKQEKQREYEKRKKGGSQFSVKKEGSAQVVIVGSTNSGKSTLLKELTNAKVEINSYPFTTKKPEVGIMDYFGIKIQVIEIPAVVHKFSETANGPALLSIIRGADLMILMFNNEEDKKMLDSELIDVDVGRIIYFRGMNLKEEIWKGLRLIKVYTKQPGKEKDYPPVALRKGATVRDLAEKIHKDFVNRFRYARVFGRSVKFNGSMVGLDHKLEDDDVVEIHLS